MSQIPKVDLTTLFLSISSAAFMGLGIVPGQAPEDPKNPKDTHSKKIDLELARQNIDLLELLQEKTKGNRTADEDRLLEQLLFETRLRFVETERNTKPH